MRKWSFVLIIALMMSIISAALAQRPTGVISGRVMTEDGQPIINATISLVGTRPLRGGFGGRGAVVTDEEGNFHADGLDPMPYEIRVWAPGYIPAPNGKASDGLDEFRQNYSYVGDSVMITMIKGGVITGKVINSAGEPVVGVSVRAIRIRDDLGQPVARKRSMSGSARTDDRGVYRIYGLAPGYYLASTVGNRSGFYGSPFDGKIDVYYPSSTREMAAEIAVRAGEEVQGVDIRYRGERGYAISGKITSQPAAGSKPGEVSVVVRKAVTEAFVDSIFIPQFADQGGYAIYGLPNGEYELIAQRDDRSGESSFLSVPKRATINGRDAGGIDLVLAPTASIAGNIVIEQNRTESGKCESKRRYYVEEVVVKAIRDEPGEKLQRSDVSFSVYGGQPVGTPDDQGKFSIRRLRPGRYRLEAQLPDENWYVKGMTTTTNDAGRNGVTLKSGEEASGLAIVIAGGSGGIKGKLVVEEGAKPPLRSIVHLIPAEIDAKDDLLRYAEARVEIDGSFNFANLSPGKYLFVTRKISEGGDDPVRPLAWDRIERVKLRKEAESANMVVELKSCQRISDYVLRFAK
jgi:hypothetical protein